MGTSHSSIQKKHNQSVDNSGCCGGCCTRYDYKKQRQRLLEQINNYRKNLQNSIGEFKGKTQKMIRGDLQTVKDDAFQYIKQNNQYAARKQLKRFFNQQKQPKLITRQIDFLEKKDRMLNQLRNTILSDVKPKKTQQKRTLIMKHYDSFHRIKQLEYNQNQDQISGDSGDIDSYIDRIIEELKRRIPPERPPTPQKKPVKQRQPSGDQYRQTFLRKLRSSNKQKQNRYRRLSNQQILFFKQKIEVSLTNSQRQSNRNNTQNKFMLDCQGFDEFNMSEFIKGNWSNVEVVDLQQCNINSDEWRQLVQAQRRSLPNLKILYLNLNRISTLQTSDLQCLNKVKHLSFGWWNQSNPLTQQSKNNIVTYLTRNNDMQIQFPNF